MFPIGTPGSRVGRGTELSSVGLKERSRNSKEVRVSLCLVPLQSGGYGALFLIGLAVNGLNSPGGARRLRLVVLNRLRDGDWHAGSLLGCGLNLHL